ncbi:MAG: discoidin domain-containing protein [Candidatus Sericytochromatia bacterium]|nr:discoidin domain-containing protein [Candidatus Sericytochromatia bacterium]
MHRFFAGCLTGVLVLVAGCRSAAVLPTPPAARLAIAPEASASETRWETRFEVDPLHGAAFEQGQPLVGAPPGAPPLIAPLDVSHDLPSGKTRVTWQLTHAASRPGHLQVSLSAEGLPGGGQVAWRLLPGESRELVGEFENPGAGGFQVRMKLTVGWPATAPQARYAVRQTSAWRASASGSYGALVPARSIDGDAATQWAHDGYRAPSAWLAIDLGQRIALPGLRLKIPPFTGAATYRIETSDDAQSWQTVVSGLRNLTWQSESRAFPSGTWARHVRLVFTNDVAAPENRFSVFEVGLLSAPVAGPTASPTATPLPSPAPSVTPVASPSPTASVQPSPTPTLAGTWRRDFETDPLGSDPVDFIDPRQEGYRYDWMPEVPWRVTAVGNSKQYLHDGLANKAFLSFRRWRGNALGQADGRLPDRYFTELDVTPLRSYTYSPTGDQGTQVYYLDPLRYAEVLIKPSLFEVWIADGAAPFQSRGWSRLFYAPLVTAAGQRRKLGALVDATAGRLQVFVDGNPLATVSHPLISTQPHYFALRGAGNQVVHDNILIQPR